MSKPSFTKSRESGKFIQTNYNTTIYVKNIVLNFNKLFRYDFIPTVLDMKIIDKWLVTHDNESLNMSRELIKYEGLLCGGSSGANVVAAMQLAKDLPEDKRVVVILPDGIRNYMTKFVSDHWMEARGFLVTRFIKKIQIKN